MKKNKIIVVFSSHLSESENDSFKKHIKSSIGCSCDVFCYENYNQHSLTEIYNKAKKEYYTENSIMVYCHNDIIFKTKNWGRILLTKFNSTNYSIIGVAGSTYIPESGVWWEDKSKMVGIVEHTDGIREWVSEYSVEKKGKITDVLLIDGLFMAVDWDNTENDFNEEYKGFHFYDVSWSFNNWLSGCDIGVTTDIRILHKSVGAVNEKWEENRKQFVNEFKDELPRNSVKEIYLEKLQTILNNIELK